LTLFAYSLTRKLDDDEVKKANLQNVGLHNNRTLISESGLYSATLFSNKPEAKAFQKVYNRRSIAIDPPNRQIAGFGNRGSPCQAFQKILVRSMSHDISHLFDE